MEMTQRELEEIIEKHKLWVMGKKEGMRADLGMADLEMAILNGADLRMADLRGARLPNL